MDWNKKMYPKDIWNWIKGWFKWVNLGLPKSIIPSDFMPNIRIRVNNKTIFEGKNRKGGFTPRTEGSYVDRALFDDRKTWNVNDIERELTPYERKQYNKVMSKFNEEMNRIDNMRWNRMTPQQKRKSNLSMAEKTGLWDVEMDDFFDEN